ncbi:MAG: hypothetical protein A2Z11_00670 [Candidatus Woykebacteria bacterium RBG_16_43_9]|uniref:Leucine--tRNA ligase n=1 Tax=Candidatus Woykebacteria bacterium RBG_16_43_9 TaxID=1802596 RepID=A0A1G1WCD6_9BACT|nr:MAG: hypothetical protein A2Z11_00670 [Candidatus Woykebacteria bacterium RBG_16_43_9]
MNDRYNPAEIEKKWRPIWEKNKVFRADLNKAKNPLYNLMMFPYPSGEGLHVGHVYAFGGSDTFGRFKKLQGYDVFEPMGFDSFGIHSENYAIKKGIHPKDLIEETTKYFREKQLKRLGALFDWDHQVITSDPDYYRWTQWLFIQLFKAGLAQRKKAPVDWCPSCKTVLADEQVINGHCERCSTQVIQKELEQWFFKITAYAEKLLKNLDCLPASARPRQAGIDWSETTKLMQRNWIGRSEGVEIEFPLSFKSTDYGLQPSQIRREQKSAVDNSRLAVDKIKVFTTRPDTIFGATFMILAPEHDLALKISSARNSEAVSKYIAESKRIPELERTQAKTGVFTGSYCINPLTNKAIPIWVADYVLGSYGTGAIMAVPAHDLRDWEFAKKHGLPIIEVISGGDVEKEAYVGEGKLLNSEKFDGLSSKNAIENISNYIEGNKLGKKTVSYHLRDWLISRQRYWGPPIPMIYCEKCADQGKSWFTGEEAKKYQVSTFSFRKASIKYQAGKTKKILNSEYKIQDVDAMRGWYPVPERDLPVSLPYLKDYQPKGKGISPLATLPDFLSVNCPECGKTARRETDVSDTFLDSSWYYLRYPSVGIQNGKESELPWNTEITKKWLPVDMYIGGNEHAVMHLLYTRFVTMALKDMNLIDFEEPFEKFRAHGLIIHGGAKMSKSRGNVVNPNEYMDAYGSDALRMYLLFIGPYELGGDFSDRAIVGMYRFLSRVWKFVAEISSKPSEDASNNISRAINRLISKVEADLESLKFNTAIAAIMEFTNLSSKSNREVDLKTLKKYLIVLAPLAPFTTEELWERIGGKGSIHNQKWPQVETAALVDEQVTVVVQVNGKLRDTLEIQKSKVKNQKEIEQLAFGSDKVKKHLTGKKTKNIIYVPGKVLNIVLEVRGK